MNLDFDFECLLPVMIWEVVRSTLLRPWLRGALLAQVEFAKLFNAQINSDETFSKSDDDLDHEMTLRLRELKE